ncbi:uncharacterized protein LOC131427923 [Malaya genurostris]|uniref:uncharacterized protein LOC131427923 n=1 Tax=Malaya genurostris TaxID=325434 RepID=UPI0026F3F76E|nr:uncharacterized protein LOC131427923 [Malaya genurostris]
MESSTETLNDSMVDVIERAEAFLSAFSNILTQSERSQNNSTHDLFESSVEGESFIAAANTSDTNSSSLSNDISLSSERLISEQPGTNDLAIYVSNPNTALSEEIEVLSDISENSDGTISYEIELPEARFISSQISLETDDCIIVPQEIPTIDLCTSSYGMDVDVFSRRNRRRLGSSVPVVESITLDDTVIDTQVPLGAAGSNLFSNGNEIATKQISSEIDLNSTRSSDAGLPCAVNCPICFDPIYKKGASSTICGHLFCHTCINHEIKLRKMCPLCKRKLMRSQVHRIYFN